MDFLLKWSKCPLFLMERSANLQVRNTKNFLKESTEWKIHGWLLCRREICFARRVVTSWNSNSNPFSSNMVRLRVEACLVLVPFLMPAYFYIFAREKFPPKMGKRKSPQPLQAVTMANLSVFDIYNFTSIDVPVLWRNGNYKSLYNLQGEASMKYHSSHLCTYISPF